MATPKTAPASAPVQPSVCRGFSGLQCPYCGKEDGIHINLAEVTAFECSECDAQFGPEDVARLIEAWTHVLVWIDQAPRLEEPTQ